MNQSTNVKAGITAIEHLLETWGKASQRGAITDAEYCELLEELKDRAATALEARQEEIALEPDQEPFA